VVLGFAWQDHDLCRRHNDYLLEAAAASNGRLVPFCMVQPKEGEDARDEMQRVAGRGARGLGELRPLSQGYDLIDSDEADLLAWASSAWDLPLLFHASEPAGHPYPGKSGLPVDQLARFIADFPGVSVIAAYCTVSIIRHHPGPDVAVIDLCPAREAPTHDASAEISSGAARASPPRLGSSSIIVW